MNKHSLKRQSHYFFAHQELKEMAYNEPGMFQNIMQSVGAPAFLADLYNELKAQYNDRVNIGATPNDFDVKVLNLPQGNMILISLPATIIAPEAKYIGIVLPADLKSLKSTSTGDIRYFTLERADNSQNPDFVRGEWKNLGTHANYGTIENPSPESFIAWIKQMLK